MTSNCRQEGATLSAVDSGLAVPAKVRTAEEPFGDAAVDSSLAVPAELLPERLFKDQPLIQLSVEVGTLPSVYELNMKPESVNQQVLEPVCANSCGTICVSCNTSKKHPLQSLLQLLL